MPPIASIETNEAVAIIEPPQPLFAGLGSTSGSMSG